MKIAMTPRQRKLLGLVSEHYIDTGHPVASGVLAQDLGMSPATVRYDLLDLQEQGFVTKPHSSAGRMPTRTGFWHYALSLLPPTPLPARNLSSIAAILADAGFGGSALARLATSFSGYPAIVRFENQRPHSLKRILLTPLENYSVLLVMISEGGRVQENILNLGFQASESLLSEAENRFRERGSLEELAGDSPYLRELLLALRQGLKSEAPITFREGAGLVLDQQEADDPEFVRRALGAIDSPPEGPLTPPGRINIQVGEIEGLAMVQAGFAQGVFRGEISLIGPLRMRYRKAISVVYSLSLPETQHAS